MMAHRKELLKCLETLSTEAKELYLGSVVPELEENPESPLKFYRDWVSYNRPVAVRKAISNWPATTKWTNDYLRDKLKESKLTVSVTPNGYADSISGKWFVTPHEEEVSMGDFIDIMEQPEKFQGVHYIQKQNSNFSSEFSSLLEDISELPWASEAFGKKPDAVNFWMGDERAVTSTHKDPYDNIYAVVRGHKDFILYPPSDAPWLDYQVFPPAVFRRSSEGGFSTEELSDMDKVPWITVDPLRPDLDSHPLYSNASPVHVRVNEGDVLYIPSLWFHHVRQSHGCIAVNFWYDMEFDCKYNYFNFLQNVNKLLDP